MGSKSHEILKKADAVCFDVDSTVIQEEGIDELAKFCDKGAEVTELTKKAMGGAMTFQDSLRTRLEIIQPTEGKIQEFLRTHPATLTPGIKELVGLLHSRQIPVFLISGGFRSIIAPIAQLLNIPTDHIYANRLMFTSTGAYAGFDEAAPTSRTGGKGVVVEHLKDKYQFKNVVLIGDGATDLEASPPADAFIGFGGNVARPIVQARAPWFVTDFQEIIDFLKSVE